MKKEHLTFFCTEFNYVVYQIKGLGYNYCFHIGCKERGGSHQYQKNQKLLNREIERKIIAMPQNTPYCDVYLNKIGNNILRHFVIFLATPLSSLRKHKV